MEDLRIEGEGTTDTHKTKTLVVQMRALGIDLEKHRGKRCGRSWPHCPGEHGRPLRLCRCPAQTVHGAPLAACAVNRPSNDHAYQHGPLPARVRQ